MSTLTFSMLSKNFSRRHFKIFRYFFPGNSFVICQKACFFFGGGGGGRGCGVGGGGKREWRCGG